MTERFVKVEFDYDPLKADELSLAVGEYLRIVKSTDPDWWVGQKASGEQGWFPSNFVVPAETSEATGFKPRPLSGPPKRELPEPAPSLPVPAPDRVTLARVEFDYDPQASDELELKQGEVITIISKDTGVNGWWRGDRNGKTVFPSNFVAILDVPKESSSDADPNTVKQQKLAAYGVKIPAFGAVFTGGMPALRKTGKSFSAGSQDTETERKLSDEGSSESSTPGTNPPRKTEDMPGVPALGAAFTGGIPALRKTGKNLNAGSQDTETNRKNSDGGPSESSIPPSPPQTSTNPPRKTEEFSGTKSIRGLKGIPMPGMPPAPIKLPPSAAVTANASKTSQPLLSSDSADNASKRVPSFTKPRKPTALTNQPPSANELANPNTAQPLPASEVDVKSDARPTRATVETVPYPKRTASPVKVETLTESATSQPSSTSSVSDSSSQSKISLSATAKPQRHQSNASESSVSVKSAASVATSGSLKPNSMDEIMNAYVNEDAKATAKQGDKNYHKDNVQTEKQDEEGENSHTQLDGLTQRRPTQTKKRPPTSVRGLPKSPDVGSLPIAGEPKESKEAAPTTHVQTTPPARPQQSQVSSSANQNRVSSLITSLQQKTGAVPIPVVPNTLGGKPPLPKKNQASSIDGESAGIRPQEQYDSDQIRSRSTSSVKSAPSTSHTQSHPPKSGPEGSALPAAPITFSAEPNAATEKHRLSNSVPEAPEPRSRVSTAGSDQAADVAKTSRPPSSVSPLPTSLANSLNKSLQAQSLSQSQERGGLKKPDHKEEVNDQVNMITAEAPNNSSIEEFQVWVVTELSNLREELEIERAERQRLQGLVEQLMERTQ